GFLGYLLKSNNVRYQIQKESQGTKVLSINAGRLSNIKISFPALGEQRNITKILSALYLRIDCSMKTFSELEKLRCQIEGDLLSQKIRFKNETGNNYPDWKRIKIEEVCEKQSSN